MKTIFKRKSSNIYESNINIDGNLKVQEESLAEKTKEGILDCEIELDYNIISYEVITQIYQAKYQN